MQESRYKEKRATLPSLWLLKTNMARGVEYLSASRHPSPVKGQAVSLPRISLVRAAAACLLHARTTIKHRINTVITAAG